MEKMKKEQLEDLNEYQPIEPEVLNRRERRQKKRFFQKELEKHKAKKPVVDIKETDPKKMHEKVLETQSWGTRLMILERKIASL